MRFALLLTLSLAWSSASWSQLSAPVTTPASVEPSAKSDSSTGTKGVIEQRTERIHVEDNGARIDELRVGGETRTIDVQPKGGMPAYQIEPVSGERTWKILGF